MTPDGAKRVVVGSLAATGALAAAKDLTGGRAPKLRILFGVFTAGMVLAMLAEAAPQVAGTFALLMLSTAVFTAGSETFGALGRLLGRE